MYIFHIGKYHKVHKPFDKGRLSGPDRSYNSKIYLPVCAVLYIFV